MDTYGEYDNANIFSKILRGEAPCVKVYEDDVVLAIMDIFPESDGHLLVLPKAPSRNFLDMAREDIGPYMEKVHDLTIAVQKALQPDGIKVMQYNEEAATQTVYHMHFHIVPCYKGIALKEHSTERADSQKLHVIAEKIRNKIHPASSAVNLTGSTKAGGNFNA